MTQETTRGGRRVLIVDDSPRARTCISLILAPLGWRMDEAGDGAAAFNKVLDSTYDLLITDLQMLPVDGAHLIAAVRLLPVWRQPRILICSADADASGVRYATAFRQADAIAGKPINARELVAEAVQLVAKKQVSEWER